MQIFTYWDSEKLPILNEYCIYTWRKYNPDFSIVILNDTNIHKYVKTFPINYEKLIVQHKSDYIRTYLLYHYGGIWIDSTLILRGKLGDIFDLKIKDKLQLILGDPSIIFFKQISKYKNRYFHNSFLCCLTPQNELVKAWLNNFNWCIENLNPQYIYEWANFPHYFKDLYTNINKGRELKETVFTWDFKQAGFTYYLTHMNILSVLVTLSDTYVKYYVNTHKHQNFLFWENNKFEYDNSQLYIKIAQGTRTRVIELIENNRLYKHPELSAWIEVEYFKDITNS